MKNVERALIATGVALVFSGGIASAAILWTSATAAAAQPGIATQLAAQLGTDPVALADNGLHGGADLMTAAATYIGITAADLRKRGRLDGVGGDDARERPLAAGVVAVGLVLGAALVAGKAGRRLRRRDLQEAHLVGERD